MSTPNPTSEYLLLFRGGYSDRSLSPAEMQTSLAGFVAWFEKLLDEGTVKAGQPLMDDARIVSGKGGRNVADEPFAESKEAIGGYFLVHAASFDDAVAIAQQCPLLDHGTVVEVRPIAAECPALQLIHQATAEALSSTAT